MHHTDTVIIGAGHAGLAVSRLLTEAGHDHVVLDRGRVAERWRSERWDSLHLLTPNWMTRLPGFSYRGPDPDGHLPAHRLVRHLETYAASFRAPVLTDTGVRQVARSGDGYRVDTDRGGWTARSVVIATGPGEQPHLPTPRGARTPASMSCRHPGTATRSCSRPAGCWWSEPPPRESRSLTSWHERAARWWWPSGATPVSRAATAGWTCSGGWNARAGSRAPSTRSRTSPRRVVSRRCSSWDEERRASSPRTWTWPRSQARGVRVDRTRRRHRGHGGAAAGRPPAQRR